MSIRSRIIDADLSPDEKKIAQQLDELLNIVKSFGWESLTDARIIKPNMRAAQLYLRRNAKLLTTLFPNCKISFDTLSKQEVVDRINPLLINIWHIQIIGDPHSASIELLRRNDGNSEE